MKERIQEILRREQLTAAQFADKIGVQRSSVSHVLSGRNNPSIDFLQKIMQHFEGISAEWLLAGRGEFRKAKRGFDSAHPSELLFGEENPSAQEPKQLTIPAEIESHEQPAPPKLTESMGGKRIERVLLFYSDNTFSEYRPH
ncbi:MAG: helix-turn-helix transcriptional regulator [Bacteroidales bacterium]